MVHNGGPGRDLEKPAENYQGLHKIFLHSTFNKCYWELSYIDTFKDYFVICRFEFAKKLALCVSSVQFISVHFSSVIVSLGARAGAAEGAEEAGRKRQVASGVCSTCQRFPSVAAGDQVQDQS